MDYSNYQINSKQPSLNILKSSSFSKELELDYKDFDPQKCGTSPRKIFQGLSQNMSSSHEFTSEVLSGLETSVDSYLDLVNQYYFSIKSSTDSSNINSNSNISSESESSDTNKFKFTSLDLLLNPLRSPFPFEKWSPYEIALFECCICKFGKNFEIFEKIIKTKSVEEIQEFFYQWEQTKYHEAWISSMIKKGKFAK